MERPLEIPPIHIPDEITHVNMPEIGETTPHPRDPQRQAPAEEPDVRP